MTARTRTVLEVSPRIITTPEPAHIPPIRALPGLGSIYRRAETISWVFTMSMTRTTRLHLSRTELEWSRLELGLLFGGCWIGGMRRADALEELAEV